MRIYTNFEMYRIDVIVPVFNTNFYLERCLDSLMKQDIDQPYHVYIVDDGSTDLSAETATMFCEKYPDVFSYIYKQNGGQSTARNIGINKSQAEYLVFVDSDDYVEPIYLSTLYELCIVNDAQISMCGVNRVYGDDGKGRRFDSGFYVDFVSEDIDKILLSSSFVPFNKMFRREIIGDLRFPEGITYEDFALIPQIMNRANKIVYTHSILYHYYVNYDSTIMTAVKNKVTNRDIIAAQHILEESDLSDKPTVLENFFIRRVLLSMAWSLLENNDSHDELLSIINEGYEKYPDIKSNEVIYQQGIIKRCFLELILSKKITLASFLVKAYNTGRRAYHAIKHNSFKVRGNEK